jgi:hypothetical protein
MGLTIVQKSDLSTRKRTGRIALVLAGRRGHGAGPTSSAD